MDKVLGNSIFLYVLMLSSLMLFVESDLIFECPEDWPTFQDRCYFFVMFPEVIHDDARVACGYHGASLVGINSREENEFISSWLVTNDLSRNEYYTSGFIKNVWTGDMIWESDGTTVPPDLDYWLSEEERNTTGAYIVYKYGVTRYAWSRSHGSTQHPYICEIKREESYRIVRDKRGFDYGLNITDPNAAPFGPHFTLEPFDVIEVRSTLVVSIECVVLSNPLSKYSIYHNLPGENETLVTPQLDERYSITSGKLTIYNPDEEKDSGYYHCDAENDFGRVLGKHMQYSFGYMGEFSNVEREPVRVEEHHYGVISCEPPNHRPALSYNWIKGSGSNFIQTSLNPHIFISYNGKIYFSEVARSDEQTYRCLVKLITDNEASIGNSQAPSRISLPVPLIVQSSLPMDWGPELADDFITAFPKQPKRGQRVRMECLAYGTLPIRYNWLRKDGLPLPPSSLVLDHNRILYIYNVQLEDSTTYICEATRGSSGKASKEFYLTVESKPYFIFPLQDKHVDVGAQLTWRCEAKAVPKQQYSWYKNGVLLKPIPGEIEVSQNVIVILNLNADRNNGMYQCRASNIHGDAYSTGQLRVLSFKPSFVKHPVEPNIVGTAGGNTTIICEPEAAPFPTFTWLKNGQNLGLVDGDTTSRIRKLRNGNLLITQMLTSDVGHYTCVAGNENGKSESSGHLRIIAGTAITVAPSNVRVLKNSTAFFACEASHNIDKDLVIVWRFNNIPLNLADGHYRVQSEGITRGLYIIQALYRHGGVYSCIAKTTFDSDERTAILTVLGPPTEPAGVYIEQKSITLNSMVVWWMPSHVRQVNYYSIQGYSHFEAKWNTVLPNIADWDTVVEGREHRTATVVGLNPGTAYNMRVLAGNSYGLGAPSLPSASSSTPQGPPQVAPVNITGGHGKVGDLHVLWAPLSKATHGGDGIGYKFYWRKTGRDDKFLKQMITGNADHYVETVGTANYYLQYDVIIQAYNMHGDGPNSSIVTVYSAEALPLGVPLKILAIRHNATSLNVTWIPVPDTREYMNGRVMGYQINYWKLNETDPLVISVRHLGQLDGGTVIGLEPNTMYEVDTQVFNTAGLGPRSEMFRQATFAHPPLLYPTEIKINSHGSQSCRVQWRGITTSISEEPLRGYAVRYWLSTDNIRTAYDLVLGKVSEAVIYGIEPGQLYKLRVFGFSQGGNGKMSPDLYFTLGGAIAIDPETTEIIAAGERLTSPLFLLFILIISSFIL